MKTLIIKYLPSAEHSNTKKLLDVAIAEIKKYHNQNIEELDLLSTKVPLFDKNSIQSYYKRNYNNINLSDAEQKLLEQNDLLIKQFKQADSIIIACPMHNFGFPGLVKLYLDAVVFFNETFAYDKKMMMDKKILTLYTSGAEYSKDTFNPQFPNCDGVAFAAYALFNFMGFSHVQTIGTSLRGEENYQKNFSKVSSEIIELIKKWYSI